MLSRVAGNIYWTARYIERVENTARLVNVTSHLLLDLPKSTTFGWQPLIAIMGCDNSFYAQYKEPNERNVTKFLLGDFNNSSSILSCLACARENMRTTRDIIPADAWEQLNNLFLYVKNEVSSGISKSKRYDFLRRVILSSQQITGVATGTMSRNAAYNFLRMGSYIERADMTTRILDVRSANLLPKHKEESNISLTPFEHIQWMSVLKSLTAYQSYRQQVRLRVKGPDVLKFLLQDMQFPRAILFCVGVVENCLSELPCNESALRCLARLQRKIRSADVYKLAYQGLHEFMDDLQIDLGQIHGHIATSYFGVETPPVSSEVA